MSKEKKNAAVVLEAKKRLAAMTPEHREESLLNLLKFMCSDDDGNWDEAKAARLRAACAKSVAKLEKAR
jgi:hypothetical protein